MQFTVGQWDSLIVLLMSWIIFVQPVSNQGLACYKCMSTDPNDDRCADPFSSIRNPIHNNCQATSMNKNGTFPARYCMKISGRILSIEGNRNHSLLNTYIYYRTCLIDNIMDSSKALETSGSFNLKGYLDLETSFRVQGSLSLCTFDGCNHAHHSIQHCLTFTLFCLLILCLHQHRVQNR